MVSYSPLTAELKAIIADGLSPDSSIVDRGNLVEYSSDASTLSYLPELVVLAGNTDDIKSLIELANRYNFPVTPRGGGSGLAGGCLPSRGGVVLSTMGLDRIERIDTGNFIMKVGAGVISLKVREAAEAAGLFYPPDPAGMDQSTIGGNGATDAGGHPA
ncbi:hypothetical protein DGMP_24540 [Desulfomarina profundi]|uniref:FAD-binding PCMH-type domain-containing protein n=1 Tax=Desulfomarina profundi TaxID=2772557 RepID=A0A8D5JS61_9BACT|nr:FAD-binding oxidoreductase [Desulfomarina profundi]BCL61761.1 hypothetical protein DGMP_24540 [Desulfomarina profundi]